MRPSLRWWLFGMALHPVGFVLIGLRDSLPDAQHRRGQRGAGGGGELHGHRVAHLLRPARARACLFGLPLVVGLLSAWFTYPVPSLHWRVVWTSLLMGVLIASCARAVFRRDGPAGTVARLTVVRCSAWPGALMLARAVHEAWVPAPPSTCCARDRSTWPAWASWC